MNGEVREDGEEHLESSSLKKPEGAALEVTGDNIAAIQTQTRNSKVIVLDEAEADAAKREQVESWEAMAAIYGDVSEIVRAVVIPWVEEEMDRVYRHFPNRDFSGNPICVLDLGGGNGKMLKTLSRHGERVIHVEPSDSMMRGAKQTASALGLLEEGGQQQRFLPHMLNTEKPLRDQDWYEDVKKMPIKFATAFSNFMVMTPDQVKDSCKALYDCLDENGGTCLISLTNPETIGTLPPLHISMWNDGFSRRVEQYRNRDVPIESTNFSALLRALNHLRNNGEFPDAENSRIGINQLMSDMPHTQWGSPWTYEMLDLGLKSEDYDEIQVFNVNGELRLVAPEPRDIGEEYVVMYSGKDAEGKQSVGLFRDRFYTIDFVIEALEEAGFDRRHIKISLRDIPHENPLYKEHRYQHLRGKQMDRAFNGQMLLIKATKMP